MLDYWRPYVLIVGVAHEIRSITDNAVTVGSETGHGLQWQIDHMQQALMMPIIDAQTLQRISDRAAIFEANTGAATSTERSQ